LQQLRSFFVGASWLLPVYEKGEEGAESVIREAAAAAGACRRLEAIEGGREWEPGRRAGEVVALLSLGLL
jgi:hypothetical protein